MAKKKEKKKPDVGKYGMTAEEVRKCAEDQLRVIQAETSANNPLFGMREYIDERHGKILVTNHVHFLIEKNKSEACPQRTPEWYDKRNNHITASVMATICGANPYERRSSALKKKTGAETPFQGNAATRHGNKYEFEALLEYEKRRGEKVLEFGLLESLNEGEEFLAGSPDGITASGRLIEIKCPLRRTPTNQIPEHYKYQIQFLMHTLRLSHCDFIQYIPGGFYAQPTFIITTEKYDPHFFYSKLPILKRFWEEVQEIRAYNEGKISKLIEDEKPDGYNTEEEDECSFTPKALSIQLEKDEQEQYYKNTTIKQSNKKKPKPPPSCLVDAPAPVSSQAKNIGTFSGDHNGHVIVPESSFGLLANVRNFPSRDSKQDWASSANSDTNECLITM